MRWNYQYAAAIGAVLAVGLRLFLFWVEPATRDVPLNAASLLGTAIGGAVIAMLVTWARNLFVRQSSSGRVQRNASRPPMSDWGYGGAALVGAVAFVLARVLLAVYLSDFGSMTLFSLTAAVLYGALLGVAVIVLRRLYLYMGRHSA